MRASDGKDSRPAGAAGPVVGASTPAEATNPLGETPAVPSGPGVMADPPLVSVVMATRDRERYLGEALASLAAQSYPRIEILLVNDGSTDGTAALLAAFAAAHPNARVIETEGLGPGGARARGFALARGDFFALQDDDDLSRPQRIDRQVSYLLDHPAVHLIGTATEIIDPQGAPIGPYALPHGNAAIRRMLRRRPPFVHGSVMMRREAYQAAGGYRGAFPVVEDFDLYLRLPARVGLENLTETLYAWRHHSTNTLERHESNHFFYLAVARAFADERKATGRDSADLLDACAHPEAFVARYRFAGRLLGYLGEAYARVGRPEEARRALLRALRRPGARLRSLVWLALAGAIAPLKRGRGVTTGGLVLPDRPR